MPSQLRLLEISTRQPPLRDPVETHLGPAQAAQHQWRQALSEQHVGSTSLRCDEGAAHAGQQEMGTLTFPFLSRKTELILSRL